MGLDFVLVHHQHHYLATKAEKLDYFVGKLGLISHLSRVSTDRGTARNTTTRYFADKFPLFLSGASCAPACGRVLLCGRYHREALGP
jgi:hypothetical protein